MLGQRIGSYRIVRKLGEGGMGTVFEAVHEQIGRRAAVKVLHAELGQNPQIAARFFNEARAVNIVQHAGIVGVFEFGQLPDGVAYIVMEYLAGESLSARIHRSGGRLPADALRLCRQIASALSAAHERGVVHRDLKPDNVMIVPDQEAPGGERAKILDFGIAKVAAEQRGAMDKTRTGVLMGTPAYMAPEQCRGAAGVDEKADVYALGVMLYEMLAGRLPFIAEGLGEMMAMQLYTAPAPLWELAPGTPEEVCALVHRMLAKTPKERPAMSQVVRELEVLGAPRAGGSLPPVEAGPQRATISINSLAGSRAATPSVRPLSVPGGPAPGTPHPSTLGQAAAQLSVPPRRSSARGAVLWMGLLLLGAGAAGAYATSRGDRGMAAALGLRAASAPKEAPRPALIHWSLQSDPAGAEIVADGQVMGSTPWRMDQVKRSGLMKVMLRLEGYEDREVTLDLGADETRRETLAPLPAPPPPAAAAPAKLSTPSRDEPNPAPPAKAARSKPGHARPQTGNPNHKPKVKSDDDIPILD